MSSELWQARIDLCVDKEAKTYWIMLRLRNVSGEDKKNLNILVPKAALAEAIERASRLEKDGLKERSEEIPNLSED